MIGTTLSSYRITAKLGEGGMGEVWRATDTRLGREVALKMLPEAVAANPERLARFQREARVLASLNHRNIAALHTIEEADGHQVLVMELVEGEDLTHRLDQGPVTVDEALGIARGIASALAAAHDAGIVHRDLKPANIRLTPDGTVKVLDFGLAKTWEAGESDPGALSLSPTTSYLATQAGVILGTAGYMSPEQARGRSVDRRADVWAFGVVLWEMLTGRRLFPGDTASDVIAGVINGPVDFAALPPETPAPVCRLLRRCLERDRNRRLRDLHDALLDLDDVGDDPPSPAGEPVGQRPDWSLAAKAVAAGIFLGVGAMWVVPNRAPNPEPRPPVRFSLPPAPGTAFELDLVGPGPPVLSPDGRRVAFTARSTDGSVNVWVRDLDKLESTKVPGTESPQYPFWSADGASIGFFGRASGMLHRVDLASGRVRTLCPANNGKGGTWNADGVILFAPGPTKPLVRISAEGGEVTQVTELDVDGEVNSHRHPHFLPDGNRFIYIARSGKDIEGRQIRLGALDDSVDAELTRSENAAVPVGDLLLVTEGNGLVVRPFDPDEAKVGPSLGVLAVDVSDLEGAARAVFDATADTLVYLQGDVPTSRQLRWYEPGKAGSTEVGTADEYLYFDLSHDGRMATVTSGDDVAGTQDAWLVDTRTGLSTRLTSDPGEDNHPIFSADGRLVYFGSNRGARLTDRYSLYVVPVDRSAPPKLLVQAETPEIDLQPTDVSADGLWVIIRRDDQLASDTDVLAYRLAPDGLSVEDEVAVVASEFAEDGGVLSPDGRWLAFVSYEAGEPQVFVTPFPNAGRRWRISRGGGVWPRWPKPDTVVYQDLEGRILAAEVTMTADGPDLGATRELARLAGVDRSFRTWGVTPDADRVMSLDFVTLDTEPLTVVVDWRSLIDQD